MGMTEYGYEDEWSEHWGVDEHRTAGPLGLKNSGGGIPIGTASVKEQCFDLAKSRRRGISSRKKRYEIVKGKEA